MKSAYVEFWYCILLLTHEKLWMSRAKVYGFQWAVYRSGRPAGWQAANQTRKSQKLYSCNFPGLRQWLIIIYRSLESIDFSSRHSQFFMRVNNKIQDQNSMIIVYKCYLLLNIFVVAFACCDDKHMNTVWCMSFCSLQVWAATRAWKVTFVDVATSA